MYMYVAHFSVLAMAYTLVVVKDSRKLRDARLAKEKAEAEEAKSEEVLEALKPDEKSAPAPEPPANTGKTGFWALFDLTNLKEGLKAVLKPRENHKRTLLLLTILVFELEIFIIVSTQAIRTDEMRGKKILFWVVLHSLFTSYTCVS